MKNESLIEKRRKELLKKFTENKKKTEKQKLWEEHLDMICEKDSWGNRPCDTYGYCMCAISCNEDWFIRAFAIKLKE